MDSKVDDEHKYIGIIIGTFGKSGKLKVRFDDDLS
jgi:hypothetical protein